MSFFLLSNIKFSKSEVHITLSLLLLMVFCQVFYLENAFSQEDSLIKYTPEFRFEEGVFINFSQVVHNSPIPKGRILSEADYSSHDFFDQVLNQPKLYYIDNIGNKIEIKTSKLWGYSRNGFLYIKIGDGYYRITLIGSCSHFVAYKTYEVRNNTSYPYSYSYQYPYSSYSPSSTTQTEMQQYILDFKTGRIIEYEVEGVELILMNDVELHDEYMQLSNKKKKQLKFVYIRKYNQRNPLFLVKTK